jgi:hypothetical protein
VVRGGRGRKPGITLEQIEEIVRLTQHEKPSGATHWSAQPGGAGIGLRLSSNELVDLVWVTWKVWVGAAGAMTAAATATPRCHAPSTHGDRDNDLSGEQSSPGNTPCYWLASSR